MDREGLLAQDGLLSRAQLAEIYDVSDITIRNWEARGLPVIKIGYTRFYNYEKVKRWIRKNEQAA